MKTTIQEQDGNMVAILEGRLDTVAAPETEKAMNVLNDVEDKDIIIDCTKLDFIASSGLTILVDILGWVAYLPWHPAECPGAWRTCIYQKYQRPGSHHLHYYGFQ